MGSIVFALAAAHPLPPETLPYGARLIGTIKIIVLLLPFVVVPFVLPVRPPRYAVWIVAVTLSGLGLAAAGSYLAFAGNPFTSEVIRLLAACLVSLMAVLLLDLLGKELKR